jgi:hypothetical protein
MKHALRQSNLLIHVTADGAQELHVACAHGDDDEAMIRLTDAHFVIADLLDSSCESYANPATKKERSMCRYIFA